MCRAFCFIGSGNFTDVLHLDHVLPSFWACFVCCCDRMLFFIQFSPMETSECRPHRKTTAKELLLPSLINSWCTWNFCQICQTFFNCCGIFHIHKPAAHGATVCRLVWRNRPLRQKKGRMKGYFHTEPGTTNLLMPTSNCRHLLLQMSPCFRPLPPPWMAVTGSLPAIVSTQTCNK